MANLSAYEESVLGKSLSKFWAKVAARRIGSRPYEECVSSPEGENALSFSWENYIDVQKHKTSDPEYALKDSIKGEDTSPLTVALSIAGESTPSYKEKHRESQLNDEFSGRAGTVCVVDGAAIGDVPNLYTIKGLLPHELPVKGTFVHPRITPGFSYIVRPIGGSKPLFNGKSKCLQRIGMGYGKRLTFSGDSLRENENYFWSDSNHEGYGFSLSLVHEGDMFKIVDETDNAVATLIISHVLDFQTETEESVMSEKRLEKQAHVTMQCKITYLDDTNDMFSSDCVNISGVAIATKKPKSRSPASVVKVKNCFINGECFSLVPTSSFKDITKSLTLSGKNYGDVPTTYSVSDVYPNELPVIGTFVDSRIIPGFKYRVRLLESKKHLFGGEALTLLSIGKGYGKRITFEGESIKDNQNYFWSDTNESGYGFTLQAVGETEKFRIVNNEESIIGIAKVFKVCGPQRELESRVEDNVCIKTVSVSLACHLHLNNEENEITTRIQGIAFMSRQRGQKSQVLRIEQLKFLHLFNSQCNLAEIAAFVQT